MTDVVIVDAESREEQTRPLTDEERAQRQADLAEAEQQQAAQQAETAERSDADTQLGAVRAKAKEVWAGNGTFTAAQVQKILAGLVLRSTR